MRVLGAAAALMLCGAAVGPAPVSVAAGERIYREGVLASGQPLRGERADAPTLEGHYAACVQCHRPSGMGMVEGQIVIPPITGRYLFQPGRRIAPDSVQHSDATHLPPTPPNRVAYDMSTLARAIRDGIGADGGPLDYLMPRFDLDDSSMNALIGYLRQLSARAVPGATDSTLQFATILTPDADPVGRRGMLDVLEKYFVANNENYRSSSAQSSAFGGSVQVQRRWQLHVWQLEGAPSTWEDQLARRLKAEPVFAVISGLGGADWSPVHRFCERQSIPCLLPNVDLPVDAQGDFYPVYYSAGVLLEARLIAARVAPSPPATLPPAAGEGRAGTASRIVQVFRSGDIGAAAAARLRESLPHAAFEDRELGPQDGAPAIARALTTARNGDILVLWLRAADLTALPAPPPGVTQAYVSGVMGGLERAPLGSAWRSVARMTYPYELPDRRGARVYYAIGWLHFRRIPVVDERVQVDTFIACSILTQALSSMVGEYQPDYLVERVEAMLSSRIVDGYYSHLGLAPGQRFASKGGYIVHFAGPDGLKLVADSDWVVP